MADNRTPQGTPRGTRPLRVAAVWNAPSPYRDPVFDRVADTPGIDLRVYYCTAREPNRDWQLAPPRHAHEFLPGIHRRRAGGYVHLNPGISARLDAFRPDVVVTTGFSPTALLAFAWCRRHGARHVAMADGTLQSESHLSALHRWVRRRVFARTEAFVGPSEGSRRLYLSYGIPAQRIHRSTLCIDNRRFGGASAALPIHDLLYSGRFDPAKRPDFVLEVAEGVARRLGRRCSVLMVGAGPLEDALRADAGRRTAHIDATFTGFVQQHALPGLYASARLLLFPTLNDVWGVVANEACAAGLPIVCTPHAGVAGELVRPGQNGDVLPLDAARWVEACARLLDDPMRLAAYGLRSRELVAAYTHDDAAAGMVRAVRQAAGAPSARPAPMPPTVAGPA